MITPCFKSREVLENIFLYISVLNWPQSAMKVLLNISLKNCNLQPSNPYAIKLKEHLFNNANGYLCQNLLFADAERQ